MLGFVSLSFSQLGQRRQSGRRFWGSHHKLPPAIKNEKESLQNSKCSRNQKEQRNSFIIDHINDKVHIMSFLPPSFLLPYKDNNDRFVEYYILRFKIWGRPPSFDLWRNILCPSPVCVQPRESNDFNKVLVVSYSLFLFLFQAFASINKSVSSNLNEIRAKLDSRLASALITGTEWKITLRRKVCINISPV